MATAASAQPLPGIGAEFSIAGLDISVTRVGIGWTSAYAATAHDNGNMPCNWVNLTLQAPPRGRRWRCIRVLSLGPQPGKKADHAVNISDACSL